MRNWVNVSAVEPMPEWERELLEAGKAERAAYLASDNARFADLEEVGVKITRPDTTAFREAAAPVQEKYLETDAQKEIFELVKSVE